VDVVCTDPPYSEHTHAKVRRGGSFHAPDVTTGGPKRPVISTSVVLGFDSLSVETREAAAREFARLAKRWILVFSDTESAHLWRESLEGNGLEYVRTCFWDKEGGTPQFTGDRPGIGCEAITVAHRRGRKRWNGGGKRGIYRVAIESGERIHTTQKPLELIEALVRDFTDPGELILDPFAGSGTLHAAAKRLGRRAIGWEINEAWHAAAVRRIDAAREQFQLPRMPRPRQLQLEGPEKDDAA
jgi:hypothetical protein